MTCPRCGTENPTGNRFCMKCGADMIATAPEASSVGETASDYSQIVGTGASGGSAPAMQEAYSGGNNYNTNTNAGPNANTGPNAYGASPQFAPPPSSYGAGLNMGMTNPGQLAGVGGRLVAYIIDFVVIVVAAIAVVIVASIFGAIHLGFLGVLLFIAFYVGAVVYQPYCWVKRAGQTIGHQAMHMRVVKIDGGPITAGTAIVRIIGFIVDTIIFGIPVGLLWCLWDAKKQCWHDKIADTVVVQAP